MEKHDIVLIDAGLARLRTDIEAKNKDANVAIVTKLHSVRLHSDQAQGVINAATYPMLGIDPHKLGFSKHTVPMHKILGGW